MLGSRQVRASLASKDAWRIFSPSPQLQAAPSCLGMSVLPSGVCCSLFVSQLPGKSPLIGKSEMGPALLIAQPQEQQGETNGLPGAHRRNPTAGAKIPAHPVGGRRNWMGKVGKSLCSTAKLRVRHKFKMCLCKGKSQNLGLGLESP